MLGSWKGMRVGPSDSIVSSQRMAVFKHFCSMALPRNSTSRQTELRGLLFFIPPDTDTDLLIKLKLVWAWFSSADEGVHLVPVLTGSAKAGRVAFDELGTPEDGVVHDSLSKLAHD